MQSRASDLNKMKTTAIVLSAGKGTRLGADTPKQYIELGGKPILAYSLEAFEKSHVDEVIVVADDIISVWENICVKYGFSKVKRAVAGGAERYDSVMAGLEAALGSDFVLIHDGARPFITPETINMMIKQVKKYGACIAGMPVKDTIKIADEDGFISSTTERRLTWQVQTPQCFRSDLIYDAYEQVLDEIESGAREGSRVTDDAFVFSEIFPEHKIKLVEAGYDNIKITTQEDLNYARFLVDSINK